MSKEERIEFLENETQKIWHKISELNLAISEKTSELESSAKDAALSTIEFRHQSEAAKNVIQDNLTSVESIVDEINSAHKIAGKLNQEIKSLSETSINNSSAINKVFSEIETKGNSVQVQITEIEKIFNSKPEIDEKLNKLQEVFASGNDNDSKIKALYKSISDRKKEIDSLYYEIIGFVEKNKDTGEENKVPGLKDQLKESYSKLELQMEEYRKELDKFFTDTELGYKTFEDEKNKLYTEKISNWDTSYTQFENRIKQLLPKALTAGLSHAYSAKKEDEETEYKKHTRSFNIAIMGMVLISLIPIAVSINSIINNVSLEQVILRIPRMVFAILPLYVPVLWVAYSSNRKMNLAKRLIEEYTHKEVLSKTFEGLAQQINEIDEKSISSDLRVKLLYNILEVNSENPGKLISDYNKTDHPIMDALDKSIKLTNAVTKLSRIPGLNKLATTLAKKSEDILDSEGKKAEAGLQTITDSKEQNGSLINPN